MQTHLALMHMLAAMQGSPSGRILNTHAANSPIDGGYSGAGLFQNGKLVGRRGFVHPFLAPNDAYSMLNPSPVERMAPDNLEPSQNAQALAAQLLGNTKNPNYSNVSAMHARFMRNQGAY